MLILLNNIFKTAIWGGNNLEKLFNVKSPYEKTSEIWTTSAHQNGETPITKVVIQNKVYTKDLESLSQLYELDKDHKIFGLNCEKYKTFPLLAKWIDANDSLSVQVHPDDEYAMKNSNSFGKTEAWYIVSAKENAKIIYGIKENITKKDLENAINSNTLTDCLNFIDVKEGEIYYIPSGTVHALLDGVVVYEMQQSSDITYRLFDWNRVDSNGKSRDLHIKESLDVIDFDNKNNIDISKKTKLYQEDYKFFKIKRNYIHEKDIISTDENSFKICSVLDGTFTIKYYSSEFTINKGESFILSANEKNTCSLTGNGVIIETICN